MIKKLVTDFISAQTQNLRDKVAEKCFKLAIENVPEFRQLVGDVAELRQFAIAQTKNTVVVSHALNTQQQNCMDLANALGHIASNQRENALDMSFPPLGGSSIFGAN